MHLNQLNYKVDYFDHHNKLIDYLQQYKPDFVLNLCDEGFVNRATQELHVPALFGNVKYSLFGSNARFTCTLLSIKQL